MDKEVADKMYRMVGQLEGLDAAAKSAYCMPGDSATVAMIDAIRALTNRVVLSAWSYANEQTKPSTGDSDAG